jgi:hypothetical protein
MRTIGGTLSEFPTDAGSDFLDSPQLHEKKTDQRVDSLARHDSRQVGGRDWTQPENMDSMDLEAALRMTSPPEGNASRSKAG